MSESKETPGVLMSKVEKKRGAGGRSACIPLLSGSADFWLSVSKDVELDRHSSLVGTKRPFEPQ